MTQFYIDGGVTVPEPSEPTIPEPVQEPSGLIWPFNVVVDFLNSTGQWIVDVQTEGNSLIRQGQLDFEKNIGNDLSIGLDWVKLIIEAAIRTSQTAINKQIIDVQKLTNKAITTSQTNIDTNVKAVQADLEKRITDLPANWTKLVEDIIVGKINPLYALQKNFDLAFDPRHGWATLVIGNIPDQIIDELDNRFAGGIRDLNRSLEAKYLNVGP